MEGRSNPNAVIDFLNFLRSLTVDKNNKETMLQLERLVKALAEEITNNKNTVEQQLRENKFCDQDYLSFNKFWFTNENFLISRNSEEFQRINQYKKPVLDLLLMNVPLDDEVENKHASEVKEKHVSVQPEDEFIFRVDPLNIAMHKKYHPLTSFIQMYGLSDKLINYTNLFDKINPTLMEKIILRTDTDELTVCASMIKAILEIRSTIDPDMPSSFSPEFENYSADKKIKKSISILESKVFETLANTLSNTNNTSVDFQKALEVVFTISAISPSGFKNDEDTKNPNKLFENNKKIIEFNKVLTQTKEKISFISSNQLRK